MHGPKSSVLKIDSSVQEGDLKNFGEHKTKEKIDLSWENLRRESPKAEQKMKQKRK